MSFDLKFLKPAVAVAAALLGAALVTGAATAAPLAPVKTAVDVAKPDTGVQDVRWRRHGWGGIGIYGFGPSIYIGPGWGYGYGYGYPRYRSYGYYPSYYDYGYYRPYRSYGYYGGHNRRWVQHRFRHPLGVR